MKSFIANLLLWGFALCMRYGADFYDTSEKEAELLRESLDRIYAFEKDAKAHAWIWNKSTDLMSNFDFWTPTRWVEGNLPAVSPTCGLLRKFSEDVAKNLYTKIDYEFIDDVWKSIYKNVMADNDKAELKSYKLVLQSANDLLNAKNENQNENKMKFSELLAKIAKEEPDCLNAYQWDLLVYNITRKSLTETVEHFIESFLSSVELQFRVGFMLRNIEHLFKETLEVQAEIFYDDKEGKEDSTIALFAKYYNLVIEKEQKRIGVVHKLYDNVVLAPETKAVGLFAFQVVFAFLNLNNLFPVVVNGLATSAAGYCTLSDAGKQQQESSQTSGVVQIYPQSSRTGKCSISTNDLKKIVSDIRNLEIVSKGDVTKSIIEALKKNQGAMLVGVNNFVNVFAAKDQKAVLVNVSAKIDALKSARGLKIIDGRNELNFNNMKMQI